MSLKIILIISIPEIQQDQTNASRNSLVLLLLLAIVKVQALLDAGGGRQSCQAEH